MLLQKVSDGYSQDLIKRTISENCSALRGVPVKRLMLCLKCLRMLEMRSWRSSVGLFWPSSEVQLDTTRKLVLSNSNSSSASIRIPSDSN